MSSPHTLSKRSLRRLLNASLRTDEDFAAFCIDYFPEVRRQFGSAMDRTTRLNLLLETVAASLILAALREQDPARFDEEFTKESQHQAGIEPASLESGDAVQDLLQDRLSALYDERNTLLSIGHDTAAVDAAILELRRQRRQGPQLQAGEILCEDRYRLLARIGRGGFSTVWLALERSSREPGAAQRVALKILHSDLAADPMHVERFYRGARRMAELQHPHIVRVIAPPCEDQGFHFFAMELLEGGDLQQAISDGKLTVEARVKAVLQAGEGLHHAHACGLIHRDVKPGNILLDRSGVARLTDFDLVLAGDTTGGTRTGALGTFLYSAPEALEDARCADIRSDVYSLGMTLASVLYGRRLPQQVLTDQVAFVARLPCSSGLRAVIRRAIALDPPARHGTIAEFCAAVTAAGGNDLGAHLLSGRPGSGGFTKRRWVIPALLGGSGLLLVGTTVGVLAKNHSAAPAQRTATPLPPSGTAHPLDLGADHLAHAQPVKNAAEPVVPPLLPKQAETTPSTQPSARPLRRKGEPVKPRGSDTAQLMVTPATDIREAPTSTANSAKHLENELTKPQPDPPKKVLHEEDWAVH